MARLKHSEPCVRRVKLHFVRSITSMNPTMNSFRASNFTTKEEQLLLDIVKHKYSKIILSKKLDTTTNNLKIKAWEDLTADFNDLTTDQYRDATCLKNKFFNIRKRQNKLLRDRLKISDDAKYSDDSDTNNDIDAAYTPIIPEKVQASSTNNTMRKGRRACNFTAKEVQILLTLIKAKYETIIECKKTDAKSNNMKSLAWRDLTMEFNQFSQDQYRDVQTLRCKYENHKKKQKKIIEEAEKAGDGKEANFQQICKVLGIDVSSEDSSQIESSSTEIKMEIIEEEQSPLNFEEISSDATEAIKDNSKEDSSNKDNEKDTDNEPYKLLYVSKNNESSSNCDYSSQKEMEHVFLQESNQFEAEEEPETVEAEPNPISDEYFNQLQMRARRRLRLKKAKASAIKTRIPIIQNTSEKELKLKMMKEQHELTMQQLKEFHQERLKMEREKHEFEMEILKLKRDKVLLGLSV